MFNRNLSRVFYPKLDKKNPDIIPIADTVKVNEFKEEKKKVYKK